MTNLIIASFSDEAKAIEASHKLTELESYGDITIYESVIVKKNADGEATLLQQTEATEGLRTLSGMAIGTMIGALAGPVGMLAGMLTGTLTGAVLESDYYDFSDDFGSKAIDNLQPGTTAIIAEVNEDSAVFIDDSLKPIGGTILRTDVDYEYDKYSDEQVEAFDAEIAEERAKIKSAAEAEKSKIQKKIGELKEKRRKRIAELKEKAQETAAKIEAPIKERKVARLKNRIEKYQAKITALEQELGEIEH
jgi:uncharacterized membrane protein